MKNKTFNRKKIVVTFFICAATFFILIGRLTYIMTAKSQYYSGEAQKLHERERSIKAARGKILDQNGQVLADNKTVCSISVIHSQLEEPEEVIAYLSEILHLPAQNVRKKVEKISSMERIKSNVSKQIGDQIREKDLPGVKVDEDYKRYYPYQTLASKVLGFTGSDNQGIVGLEVIYEEYLTGTAGTILTVTDATGVEIKAAGERRIEPVAGRNLVTTLDVNIQTYGMQLCRQVMESKEADHVSMIVLNPQNGDIYAMIDVPEFDCNNPYQIRDVSGNEVNANADNYQDLCNQAWRNGCINDTYEPGSSFKVITAAAALEAGVVTIKDQFYCPGYVIVEDRRIRCSKTTGHGAEDFLLGTMNSCNPVFVTVGLRVGASRFYDYMKQFGLLEKTGVDLPGEAGTIMHQKDAIGEVELATMSFGQSFQITPLQLATTVASLVNGGKRITPHLAKEVVDENGKVIKDFTPAKGKTIIQPETSETLQMMLEQVVANGTGKKGKVEGFSVGGKTATSQTLPRGSGKYIASFVGFSPADHPEVLALVVIHNPKGTYYGGQIAAPVVKQLFENILPYLED